MGIAGEFRIAAVDVAALQKQFGPVIEGVFNRIYIKILIDRIAAVGAGTRQGLRTTFPWVFWGFHGKYKIFI